MLGISRCILSKRMAIAAVSVPSRDWSESLPPGLNCLSSPRRASDIRSSPRAGGAGRANSARLDGRALVRPTRRRQADKFFCLRVPRHECERSVGANHRQDPRSNQFKKCTESRVRRVAGAGSIDLKGVSQKAPAGEFTRCPLNLNSHNHNQHAGQAVFLSCLPNRAAGYPPNTNIPLQKRHIGQESAVTPSSGVLFR